MAQGQNNKLFNEADHIKQSDFHNATINQNINDGYGNSYVAGTHFNILASDVTIIDPRPGYSAKTICPPVLYGLHQFEYVNEILGLSGKQFIITNEFPLPPSLKLKLTPGMIVKQLSDYKDELEIIQRNTDGQTQTFIYQVGSEYILDLNIDPVQSFIRNMVRRNRAARNNVRYMITKPQVIDIHKKNIVRGSIILKLNDDAVELINLQTPPNGTGYLARSSTYIVSQKDPKGGYYYPSVDDYMKDIQMKDGQLSQKELNPFNDESDFEQAHSKNTAGADTEIKKTPVKDTTPLKKVYCPYNADLVVYDIHNRRVHDLCGILTPEKFYDLILRINDDTKFDGFENFKCAVCELGVIAENKHPEMDNDFDALHIMTETAVEKQRGQMVSAFGTFEAADGFIDNGTPPVLPINSNNGNPFGPISRIVNAAINNAILNVPNYTAPTNRQVTKPSAYQMSPFEMAINRIANENKANLDK